jgi:hypothetical protein
MADSTVGVTTGTGDFVRGYRTAGASTPVDQYVREARATAVTTNAWNVATTGAASVIAADASRVSMLMVNRSTGRVYIRFDATPPTSSVFHWYLEPDDRYEVPNAYSQLPVSFLGTIASNTVAYTLGTAA